MTWRYTTLPDCTRLWRWYSNAGPAEHVGRIVGPCARAAVVGIPLALAAPSAVPGRIHPHGGVSGSAGSAASPSMQSVQGSRGLWALEPPARGDNNLTRTASGPYPASAPLYAYGPLTYPADLPRVVGPHSLPHAPYVPAGGMEPGLPRAEPRSPGTVPSDVTIPATVDMPGGPPRDVPEPATIALVLAGVVIAGVVRRVG